ncbi:YcxB family protein [Legionella resiliens]|uniref:YcxB family protein n=1 Tax=Legionella resiliens TaxID=2905958 RepID=A0ABS8X5S2_9GAMM|nr:MULTISPECIES: YcxB family protein [unclassified Legionella]MCE0724161.1 YcxB family protein [Legionella sp. 9fVS26]MCE3533314.1 YcxB family protein [Legionella sp. 8cVS16]
MHQTELIYSTSLIRKAIFSFWYKTVGPLMILTWLALMGYFIFLMANEDYSWITGALGAILFFSVAIAITLYLVHYRNSINKFKKMGHPDALFLASEDNFTFSSGRGSVTLPWSSIESVWRFSDYYLLFYSKSQFSIFPLAGVNEEIQHYMIRHIQDAGGKIIN